MSIERKVLDWLANGETGTSSKTMAFCAVGINSKYKSHPYDPDDLNRCIKLLDQIPEIRNHFQSIANLSNEWRLLIENWDALASVFIAEVGFDWCKGSSAPATFERMKILIG